MDPQGFNTNSRLRASDADRDRAAAVLNEALAHGRLTAEEHSERLDQLYTAKTHADIVPVIEDLPSVSAAAPSPAVGTAAATARGRRLVAVFSGISRKGHWQPEPVTRILAVCGGAEIDLRDAVLPGPEITINVVAVCGGAEITVPPEMRVIDTGTAVMGGREIAGDTAESAAPGAPVLHLTGYCICGGLEVKRKARKPK